MLRELIAERGAEVFVDSRDLLKQVQNSYNCNVEVTELEVVGPVFEAEVAITRNISVVVKTTQE